jgi:HEAT repeat protein
MVSKSEHNSENSKQIENLIFNLNSQNAMIREHARLALIKFGKLSVLSLIEALENPKKRVQWEAAKALVAIHDIRSSPALVQKLMDKSFELRWLAAEGLIALRQNSLKDLLKALIDNPDNWDLRQGAHHVLHALEKEGLLNEKCLHLLNELRDIEAGLSIPMSAEKALLSL